MQTRVFLIPTVIFVLFAAAYIIVGSLFPPERTVYCPNPVCHGSDVEIVSPIPSQLPDLPSESWRYYRCLRCGTISAADFAVHNLLFEPVWDIAHYRSIAERGYERYDCDSTKHWPRGDICGNVGWFPGWPMAVKALSLGNVSLGLKFLPVAFMLLGMFFFYKVLTIFASEKVALIGTAAIVAAPSAFYFLTGFPYAFLFALFSLYLYYLYRDKVGGRKFILPILAALISFTYPPAFMTAIIPLVMLVNQYRKRVLMPDAGRIFRDLAFHLLPFAAGPLLLSAYYFFTFDDFFLFVHFQEKYGRDWDFPLTVIYKSLVQTPAWEPGLFQPPRLNYEKISIVYYGVILILFPPYRTKPELVVYAFLFFLFSPMTGNLVSIYRHYLVLFPTAMMLAASPRPLWLKITVILAGLVLAFGWFYPFFLNGYLI